MITYCNVIPDIQTLVSLYEEVGWHAYLSDSNKLLRAYQNAQDIFSAWDSNKLVGVIRTIGDKETIVFIQDIIVAKAYQRQGIGLKLMKLILDKYSTVRQIVLLTDNTDSTINFYNSCGLNTASKYDVVCFVKYNE